MMMPKTRSWDERYLHGEVDRGPSRLLLDAISTLSPGKALDLACGAGRHALALASAGWRVVAVDASTVAIDQLKTAASREKLTIDARVADLEKNEFKIECEEYDLICVFYYLQRSLFPAIREGARRGGHVVAGIHMVDDDPAVHAMNADFLLEPGELRKQFSDWHILYYREGKPKDSAHKRKTAELIARKN